MTHILFPKRDRGSGPYDVIVVIVIVVAVVFLFTGRWPVP